MLTQAYNSYEVGAFLADAIASLREPDPASSVAAKCRDALGPLVQFSYSPLVGDQPAWFAARNGTNAYVGIDGMSTAAQAAGLVNGYFGGLLSAIANPTNVWLNDLAILVAQTIQLSGFRYARDTVIGGWSLGGALAELIVGQLYTPASNDFLHYCTFGSPRPCGPALATVMGTARGVRWMNDQDPVPLIPPRLQEAPLLAITYSPREMLRVQQFVQPSGGVQIDAAGGVSEQVLPTAASVNASFALSGWMIGLDTGGQNQHAVILYQRRLAALAAALARSGNFAPRTAPRESTGANGRTAHNEEARIAGERLRAAGENQNAVEPRTPTDRLLHAIRIGSVWVVTLDDNVVAIGPEKKRARGLARIGNDFLRRLQRQAVVEVSELTTQLKNYLADATQGGNGWIPTIVDGADFPP